MTSLVHDLDDAQLAALERLLVDGLARLASDDPRARHVAVDLELVLAEQRRRGRAS